MQFLGMFLYWNGCPQTETGQYKMQPQQNLWVNYSNSRKSKGTQKGTTTKTHKKWKRNKEKQRETQGNRFDYKFGLLCLPERDPKPKYTDTYFLLKPIFTFLHCFPYISLLFFCFVVVFPFYFHSVYHL